MRLPAALAFAAALAGLPAGAPARAETTACTVIAAVPATLSVPGHYCLEADLAAAGTGTTAVTVTASDVMLDCNHHRLQAPANSTGTGVRLAGGATRAVVRNCRIDGFAYGIASDYSAAPAPRATQLAGNYITRALYGVHLYGSGHLVEGNRIGDGRRVGSAYLTGIYFEEGVEYAVGNVIRGNTIGDLRPDGPTDGSYHVTMGIHVGYQRGAVIEDNTVHGLFARNGGGTYGIVTHDSRELVIRGNRVLSTAQDTAPFTGGNWTGIFLQGTTEEKASISCADNLVGHFNGNYNGCSATGNTSF